MRISQVKIKITLLVSALKYCLHLCFQLFLKPVLLFQVGAIIYKRQRDRNAKGLNFDNPVYRKTTEDQVIIEKSQLQPKTLNPVSI